MHQSLYVMLLISEIDSAYLKFLGRQLKEIIEENNSLLIKSVGYVYEGSVYIVNKFDYPLVTTLQYKPTYATAEKLDSRLITKHDEWFESYLTRERTIQQIRQGLSIAVKTATSAQDIRDMLPDHVISLVKMEDMPERTRPTLELKEDDPAYNEQLKDYWPEQAINAYTNIRSAIDTTLGYRFFT